MVDNIMTELRKTDFLIEVQKGNIAGHSMVHKFGRNDVVGTAWEHVSLTPFSTANFLQTPTAMFIKSGGNAADTALGNNAREVIVQGIDSTLAEVTSTIATAGAASTPATSETYWRVHRAWVSAVGTYGAANAGAVVIADATASNTYITIASVEGQTQYAGYTIPTGKTGYLLSVHVTVDATKRTDIRCMTRENMNDVAAPMSSPRIKLYWDGIINDFQYIPRGPELSLAAGTDIWFEAKADAGTSEVSVDFELLLVDN
jgi:hypothetical protein